MSPNPKNRNGRRLLRRSRQNRRSGIADTTALKKAETLLFGELASALGLEYGDVLAYIEQHLK